MCVYVLDTLEGLTRIMYPYMHNLNYLQMKHTASGVFCLKPQVEASFMAEMRGCANITHTYIYTLFNCAYYIVNAACACAYIYPPTHRLNLNPSPIHTAASKPLCGRRAAPYSPRRPTTKQY